ncbi:MAG: hypothetical protein Q4C61_07145 [Lachnospiraceae bacterium]|nr:hypothetical protein [Lachnospiraceae bacterium]
MLKDRIVRTAAGFQVLREKNGEDRQLYYGEFSLKDRRDADIPLREIRYWDPADAYETLIKKPKCYILVVEKENGEIVGSHRFFFSVSRGKPTLRISIKPKRKYGKNAHMITIEWVECNAESINSQYIYLTDQDGEKYYFLKELIQPLEPDGKRLMDQYVFTVPEGHKPEEYYVEVDPLVREKYSIED